MRTASILTRLWDHGWLCRDFVILRGASTDNALLDQYVASASFQTSFLPKELEEIGLHGPFVAKGIKADDFVLLAEVELEQYLETIQLSESPGEDAAEHAKMLHHLKTAFEGDRRCYVLSRDERNRELFHEWGFVLFVFREFVFAGPERDCLDRFIIGYD